MCIDFSTMTKAYNEYASAIARDTIEAERIEEGIRNLADEGEIEPRYHLNAYSHRKVLGLTQKNNDIAASAYEWGLVPPGNHNEEKAATLRKKGVIAKSETMFTSIMYRVAASRNRIILPLDGFFEHHDYSGFKVPYYIYDKQPLLCAAIASKWVSKDTGEEHQTMSVVTTDANPLMSVIHNKPAKSETPRMPLLLNREDALKWIYLNQSKDELREIIQPYQGDLSYHAVGKIRGKYYQGNIPETRKEKIWEGYGL